MYKLSIISILFISLSATAQTSADRPRTIFGQCNKDSLMNPPFDQWFKTGYDSYQPASATTAALKNQNFKDISVQVFFGTWCGDSKREVPHFLKLLNEISFPENKTTLIAVGNSDSLLKQSPQHQEDGKGIFRVPTIIVYKNGVEVNRINEFPVNSLEKDFLQILTNQSYSPNYHSFSFIKKWMSDGTLSDENISSRSLSAQLELLVTNENELNSLGYVLLKQGKKKDALKIFQANYYLFPQSSNVSSSLGEGYYENNDYKKAISSLERSLELNKDPKAIPEILSILYKAKEKEKG
jgi:tetratricopeptide (TPR) repeat protein